MARKNILIHDTDRIGPPGARPITRSRDRFTVTCRDLASERDSEDLAPEGDFEEASQAVRQGNRSRMTRTLDRLDSTRRDGSRAELCERVTYSHHRASCLTATQFDALDTR